METTDKQALDMAVNGHSFVLLGAAGTGKTYLVKRIHKELSSMHKNVQICCSTGIACHLYDDACTVHRFCGLSDGRYGPQEIQSVLRNNIKYKQTVEKIKECETLIIDECSMIRTRTFDTIEKACSLKNDEYLFGGIQIILVGDFFQLPPVPNTMFHDTGKYCFSSKIFSSYFQHGVLLERNMRQHDEDLIYAINEVKNGTLSQKTQNFMHTLERPLGDCCIPTLKLFAKNDLCNDFNRQSVLKSPGNLVQYSSKDSGSIQQLKTCIADKNLWLKVGVPIICTKNLTDKIVNGLQGTVVNLEKDGPTLNFPSVNITTKLKRESFTVYDPKQGRDIATRQQYPVKLAFGLTIHKSQGMTLDRCDEVQNTLTLTSLPSCEGHNSVIDEDDLELDDDFNKTLQELCEQDSIVENVDLPENFTVTIEDTKFKHEVTEFHQKYNALVSNISQNAEKFNLLNVFIKKIFIKLKKIISCITVDSQDPQPIKEREIANFYRRVHEYTLSLEFKLNSIQMFEHDVFTDIHESFCYNVLEQIRIYFLQEKATQFKYTDKFYAKRFITETSKARIRYVAGYCVAKLRNKYVKMKRMNTFSDSGQFSYMSSKICLDILRCLSEDEHFLQSNSKYPDSLIDTSRRQNVSRGLTCVTDHCYIFFINLTDDILKHLNNHNFINCEKFLHSECLNSVLKNICIFENFVNIVVNSFTSEETSIEGLLNDSTLFNSEVEIIFEAIVHKYLLTMFAQYRKDLKSSMHIEKTMAHRKQIKISKGKAKCKMSKKCKKDEHAMTSSDVQVAGTSDEQIETHPEIVPNDDLDTQNLNEENKIKCVKCNSDHENDQWIQCDSCDIWFHRRCAKLSNALKWKKYSKANAQWFCGACS